MQGTLATCRRKKVPAENVKKEKNKRLGKKAKIGIWKRQRTIQGRSKVQLKAGGSRGRGKGYEWTGECRGLRYENRGEDN